MEDFELLSALGVDDICIYFQPIVSLQRFRVIGIEALTRGLKSGEFISPQELFSRAAELKISIEFDRFCRKLALLEFKRYYKKYNHLALFLNHDPTLLNDPNVILGYTATLCKDIGINPSRVVIEICESKVTNMKLLENFVTFQKKKGFLIALDDVGTHYSNLDRIPQLKPDILKIDRNLVQNSDKEWHKNKIVKAIIYLAREIRSIPIIEGVEKEEEIIENLKMGSEYFQGFYFCKPSPIHLLDFEKVVYKSKKVASLPNGAYIGIDRCKRVGKSIWCKVHHIAQRDYEGFDCDDNCGWVNAKYLKLLDRGYVLVNGKANCYYVIGCKKGLCSLVTNYKHDKDYNIVSIKTKKVKRGFLYSESNFGAANPSGDGYCTNARAIEDYLKKHYKAK